MNAPTKSATKPLPIIREVYDSVAEAAGEAAAGQKYPCAPRCSHCCNIPVFANDADWPLVMEGLRALAPRDEVRVAAQAHAYGVQIEALSQRIADADVGPKKDAGPAPVGDHAAFLASVWPDGGLACPMLMHDGDTGKGRCAIYKHRPLQCRLHFAMGPEACRPTQPQHDVAKLDARKAHGKVVVALGIGPRRQLLGTGVAAILAPPKVVTPA